MVKLYHSREDRVAELNDEAAQVQFISFEDDIARIKEAQEAFLSYVDDMDDKVDKYIEIMSEDPTEHSPSRIGAARRDFIESWALAQATLSKVAWVLRVDGNDAYQRMINALKDGNVVDMSGI